MTPCILYSINFIAKDRKKELELPQGKEIHKFLIYVSENCTRRPIDCARIYNYFVLNGWQITHSAKDADIILVYTCGSLKTNEDRSVRTIRQLQMKKANKANLIVTGCLTKINKSALHGNHHTIMPDELEILDTIINAKIRLVDIPDANILPIMNDLLPEPKAKKLKKVFEFSPAFIIKISRLLIRRFKYRFLPQPKFYIKIAHGCLGTCTYCAIKIACGNLRSKDPDVILAEFKRGLESHYRTFVLVAEDTGCYGLDIGTNIVSLLRKLFSFEGEYKLTIRDLKPNWMIQYHDILVPLMEENRHKIAELNLPIQSGSNRILEMMKRQYKIEDVKDCLIDLKTRVPELAINTQLMTGFPGETEDDFEKTMELIKELNFEDIEIYCYEDRPGTEATIIPNKIPDKIKIRRRRTLYGQFSRKFLV